MTWVAVILACWGSPDYATRARASVLPDAVLLAPAILGCTGRDPEVRVRSLRVLNRASTYLHMLVAEVLIETELPVPRCDYPRLWYELYLATNVPGPDEPINEHSTAEYLDALRRYNRDSGFWVPDNYKRRWK